MPRARWVIRVIAHVTIAALIELLSTRRRCYIIGVVDELICVAAATANAAAMPPACWSATLSITAFQYDDQPSAR
ncbi:hypothetical protein KCP69_06055 [Salmonella enterica subsp. enterica]|nr:hypothetical protein KCP69_06055 [Salmonella enterica subsp. enterica]